MAIIKIKARKEYLGTDIPTMSLTYNKNVITNDMHTSKVNCLLLNNLLKICILHEFMKCCTYYRDCLHFQIYKEWR